MAESKNINYQYHKVITELQKLNPNKNLENIKGDVQELLYSLFIDKIENLELAKDITFDKIRRDIIRQKLQSSRQSKHLKEVRDDKIKKEKKYFKLKKIQNTLKRKAFYNSIDYAGTFSKRELFYINHTDKTFLKTKFSKNIDKDENQDFISELPKDDKSTIYKREKVYDFNEIYLKYVVDFPEIQEQIDIFKKIVEDEEKFREEKTPKIELEMELRKRILKLNLKPIEKTESKDLNLLDYIGFVDKEDDNTQKA